MQIAGRICKKTDFDQPWFVDWVDRMKEDPGYRRKLWEYVVVAEALRERGMLVPGKRGLGFAVGDEPLPSLFASYGVEILATDAPEGQGWEHSQQWAGEKSKLNNRKICSEQAFERLVSFKPVDMRAMPSDLGNFDFLWSACALEHLGDLAAGLQFVILSLPFLKPGGWAMHTTEFNLMSDDLTICEGTSVFYRKKDIELLRSSLNRLGYEMSEIDYSRGDHPFDKFIDAPPYYTVLVDGVRVHINMGLPVQSETGADLMAATSLFFCI